MNISRSMLSIVILALVIMQISSAANLWHDDFNDNSMNVAYETPNSANGAGPPQWSETGGVLKQTEPKPGDPTYCAVDLGQNIDFCGQLVRIRFDEWEDDDRSRAGVGFWLDPNDRYCGYTTLIHNSLTVGNYQFLNDARGWHGTKVDFDTGGTGSWFWMRAEIDANAKSMNGKVWVGDLEDEPEGWMIQTDYTTYGGLRNPTRWVGLNGGAGTGSGFSKISFDDWYAYDSGGPVAVDPQQGLAATWGEIKR